MVRWLTSPAGDQTVAHVQRAVVEGKRDPLTMRVRAILDESLGSDVAQAVAQALAEASGPGRDVDLAAVRKVLGSSAGDVTAFIADHQRDANNVSRLPLMELLRFTDRLEVDPRTLMSRMPALRELVRMLAPDQPLAGFELAAVQHLFETTETLFDALFACGLVPERSLLSGKPYSTDDEVQFSLMRRGMNVTMVGRAGHEGAREADHEALFQTPLAREAVAKGRITEEGLNDPSVIHLLRLFTSERAADADQRFVLLDEGGKLLKALHAVFPEHASRCVAIEQTMRGVQVLEGVELRCPVINVAESWLKKLYESPMIGESIVDDVENQLAMVGEHVRIEPKEATVLGFGAVGQEVAASLLRRGYRVRVWDPLLDDPVRGAAMRERATRMGVEMPSRDECLAQGHVVFGCSGRGSLGASEWDALPKDAVLVNAASGQHELMREVLADPSFTLPHDPLAQQMIHSGTSSEFKGALVELDPTPLDPTDREREHSVVPGRDGARRLLVRSGFVANMATDIPPELIQLTRCLLLAAVVQATTATAPGLQPVDDDMQKFIEARVRGALEQIGLSLEAPDFRKLR